MNTKINKEFKHFEYPGNIDDNINLLRTKNSSYWKSKGVKKIIALANYTLSSVPAYRKYLNDLGVKPESIRSIKEFRELPFTSKVDYLKKYPYSNVFPVGGEDKITTISSTSGSTGEPFYFPRGEEQDAQYQYVSEVFMKNQFELDTKRTLAINGFGLGIWIGGIFTYKVLNKLALKGYRLAVAPTGTDKNIFLKTFQKTAHMFDQIILMGYPPFIKDVVDEAEKYDIDWKKFNIKLLTATEGYSEKFREYLISRLGIKNRYKDIINIYGSVEFGTMSHETALCNLIRKIAVDDPKLFKNVFPDATEIPTLAQFYPHIVYFEGVGGEVIASGYGSSFPLLRYKFRDSGNVIEFDDMVSRLKRNGIDIFKLAKAEKIDKTIFRLPFVYVFSRSDFVVILRGANIYPENIRSALLDARLQKLLTGKFCMIKKENSNFEEYLEVNVELKPAAKNGKDTKKLVAKILVDYLRKKNSEFNYLYTTEGKKLTPDIVIYPYEDPKFFGAGIKQTWVKK